MAKFAVDAVLDGSLDVIATATKLVVCSAQPFLMKYAPRSSLTVRWSPCSKRSTPSKKVVSQMIFTVNPS